MAATKITNYAVCVEISPADLVRSVTKQCQEGWLPIGGVAMVMEPAASGWGKPLGITRYSQALVLPVQVPNGVNLLS